MKEPIIIILLFYFFINIVTQTVSNFFYTKQKQKTVFKSLFRLIHNLIFIYIFASL